MQSKLEGSMMTYNAQFIWLLLSVCLSFTLAFHPANPRLPTRLQKDPKMLPRRHFISHNRNAFLALRPAASFSFGTSSRNAQRGRGHVGFSLQCGDKREGRVGSLTEEKVEHTSQREEENLDQRRPHEAKLEKQQQHVREEENTHQEGQADADDLGHLLEDLQEDIHSIDDLTVQNDVSILICYSADIFGPSLSHALVDIMSQGPKDAPGIDIEDLVLIGRYFTDAASLGGAWMVAGFLTSHFRRKSLDLLSVNESDFKVVFLTWLLAAPLAQVFRALGGADVGGAEGARDSIAMLVLMLLWRYIEPFLYL